MYVDMFVLGYKSGGNVLVWSGAWGLGSENKGKEMQWVCGRVHK